MGKIVDKVAERLYEYSHPTYPQGYTSPAWETAGDAERGSCKCRAIQIVKDILLEVKELVEREGQLPWKPSSAPFKGLIILSDTQWQNIIKTIEKEVCIS